MKESFIIPIDDKIKEFKKYLDLNPRIIFSAKFGDGKSYFLSKFKDNEDVCNEYKILTIHPVNYQVLENKDIFELIKRDILAQILVSEMITECRELSDSEAYYYYLRDNSLDLMEEILKIITPLGFEAPIITPLLACVKSLRLFIEERKKIEKIKKEANTIDKADAFIDQIDESKYIYEEDIITKLIKDAINDYRGNNKDKRVALIVEDMDRLDPAHLFRIMNVFSAHVDYCNKYGLEDKELSCDNKYGFDNIVFVMDYDNVKNIFQHIYGKESDFDGYISKFSSQGYFNYSLKKLKFDYYCKIISDTTEIKLDIVKLIIARTIPTNITIRKVVESCKGVDAKIRTKPTINIRGNECDIHQGILRLIIIMSRLGCENDKIVKSIADVMTENKEYENKMMGYLVGLWFFNAQIEYDGRIFMSNWSNTCNEITLADVYGDGHVSYNLRNISGVHENMHGIIYWINDLFNLIYM